MHALRSGRGTGDFESSKIVTRKPQGVAWNPNVLWRLGLWQVYSQGRHGQQAPRPPPNRSRNHVNSTPDFFQNPMLLVFPPMSPACRLPPEAQIRLLSPVSPPG
jgi:hypothetical protein